MSATNEAIARPEVTLAGRHHICTCCGSDEDIRDIYLQNVLFTICRECWVHLLDTLEWGKDEQD